MIAENVAIIRERIRKACERAGRDPGSVRLIAVTKSFGVEEIQEAVQAGINDIGENFVQELRAKREELNNPDVRWHFVGHLQSNKVKYIADFIHLIHSVDRWSVAEEIHKRAAQNGRVLDVLVEVNTTSEKTKHGVMPEKAIEFMKSLSPLKCLRVRGMMTIGPFLPDPEGSRPAFRTLRRLSEKTQKAGIENVEITELSMGMTNDFEIAIEEGATMVRIGTAIFGPRE